MVERSTSKHMCREVEAAPPRAVSVCVTRRRCRGVDPLTLRSDERQRYCGRRQAHKVGLSARACRRLNRSAQKGEASISSVFMTWPEVATAAARPRARHRTLCG